MMPSPLNAGAVIDALDVDGVLQRDLGGVGLAQHAQDGCSRGAELLAFGQVVVDGGQRSRVGSLGEPVEFFEQRRRPLGGGQDLRGADATVMVGVDEVEGLGVELDAARRAGQRHPELLIELGQRRCVLAGVEPDLVEPAGAEKETCARERASLCITIARRGDGRLPV
jgi:hypothetical protein